MARTVRIRRRPRRLAPAVTRLVSFLGCALSLHATPAAAQTRGPVPPSRAARLAAPPWSATTGTAGVAGTGASKPLPLHHPAVHPAGATASAAPMRLFPRAAEVLQERRRRADSIARHPAGRTAGVQRAATGQGSDRRPLLQHADDTSSSRRHGGDTRPFRPVAMDDLPGSTSGSTTSYRVVRGDTLWGIAVRTSAQRDAAAVHALTQKIYDLNRDVVGGDPDLIFPGQILRLPGDLER